MPTLVSGGSTCSQFTPIVLATLLKTRNKCSYILISVYDFLELLFFIFFKVEVFPS